MQIGIGSIGDAFAYGPDPAPPGADALPRRPRPRSRPALPHSSSPFARALRHREMLVDGFLALYRAGILKRRRRRRCAVMHAGVLPRIAQLLRGACRAAPRPERARLRCARSPSSTALYGDEALKRARRAATRASSTTRCSRRCSATSPPTRSTTAASSAASADSTTSSPRRIALDGRPLDHRRCGAPRGRGPAVQHRLDLRHTTIPRHLRDIVVTEYGIADLRGEADRDCVAAMLALADARFQPRPARRRAPRRQDRVRLPPPRPRAATARSGRRGPRAPPARGRFPEYPFGSDFTAVEQRLMPALARLKHARPLAPRRRGAGLRPRRPGSPRPPRPRRPVNLARPAPPPRRAQRPRIAMTTVTVFGGTGFLGRRIVAALLARGATVRVASRHPQAFRRPAPAAGRRRCHRPRSRGAGSRGRRRGRQRSLALRRAGPHHLPRHPCRRRAPRRRSGGP